MPAKTIHYHKSRKINPALIDKRFEYGSETIEFGAWADVPEDEDIEKATADLKAFVNGEIETELQETVERLRKVARSRIFFEDAIFAAFSELMGSQNMSDEEMTIARDRFHELLELKQSSQSY